MGIAERAAIDNAALFDENGPAVDAVYTRRADKSESEIRVVLEYAAARQLASDLRPQGSPSRIVAQMLVLKSDLPDPAYQDTVEIDSVLWTVLKVLWEEFGVVCIQVDRDMRARY